jgi:hypothetical protein
VRHATPHPPLPLPTPPFPSQHNPADARLLLAYLAAAGQLLDPARVRELWDAAAARHAGDWRVWRAYLAHALADFAAFSLPAARAAHHAAIRALAAKRAAAAAEGGGVGEVEAAMVAATEQLMEVDRQVGLAPSTIPASQLRYLDYAQARTHARPGPDPAGQARRVAGSGPAGQAQRAHS